MSRLTERHTAHLWCGNTCTAWVKIVMSVMTCGGAIVGLRRNKNSAIRSNIHKGLSVSLCFSTWQSCLEEIAVVSYWDTHTANTVLRHHCHATCTHSLKKTQQATMLGSLLRGTLCSFHYIHKKFRCQMFSSKKISFIKIITSLYPHFLKSIMCVI